MGQLADDWRDHRESKRRHRDRHTIECPSCPPNRAASRLYPGQRCGWCGYVDPREDKPTVKRHTAQGG